MAARATAALLVLACGCSTLVKKRLDDLPESRMDGGAGTTDAGPGGCTTVEDCPDSERCNVVCNAGACMPGPSTGAQCGDTTNERCVAGTCRTLTVCNLDNYACPNTCQEICVPPTPMATAGVCILTSDLAPGLTADGYPCGPISRDTNTADLCFMGTCRTSVRLCIDDGNCSCAQHCVRFPEQEGGGCMPLPGTMTRAARSPCTTSNARGEPVEGTCGALGVCQTADGVMP